MTKRIALLVSLVMIFSLSFVFATEENQDTLLSAPVTSGEVVTDAAPEVSGESVVSGETTENVSSEVAENVSGEISEEVSGEEAVEDKTPADETVNNNEDTENDEAQDEDNAPSTVIGAIIAIVVVVAVVAVVALLQKKN